MTPTGHDRSTLFLRGLVVAHAGSGARQTVAGYAGVERGAYRA